MKTTKEKIEVMQAFERGEKIEYRIKGREEWKNCIAPVWDWYDSDYRVKIRTTTLYWGIFKSTNTDNKPFSTGACYNIDAYEKLKKEYENSGYMLLKEYKEDFAY